MAKETSTPPRALSAELKGFILLGLSAVAMIALVSFRAHDTDTNWLGLIGWGIGFLFSYLLGLCAYPVILLCGWIGWRQLIRRPFSGGRLKLVYFGLSLVSVAVLLNLFAEYCPLVASLFEPQICTQIHNTDFPFPHRTTRYNLGGVPLYYLYKDLPTMNLQHLLSDFGVCLTSSITALVTFFLFTGLDPRDIAMKIGQWIAAYKQKLTPVVPEVPVQSMKEIEATLSQHTPQPLYSPKRFKEPLSIQTPGTPDLIEPKKIPTQTKREAALNAQRVANGDFSLYQIPLAQLLNPPKKGDLSSLKKDLKKQADVLEETLMSFGIEAKVGQVHCGPTIASFEVHPAVGVKVQKIKTLENDIALNLQAKSIRIIAPIPGKAAVGVEIPSPCPQEVSFKELLSHYQASSKKMMIPLLLGKTVSGEAVITDLAKMPHCLIAGATGSGKSVCINTIILSILMNARPDEIKLLMIDPKKVELTPYTSLPHMIAPVITEPHGAYAALSWLVKEMQVRYELLKQLGMRNITAFNHRQINPELEASLSQPVPAKMYAIVAIIDEFADLMMASSSDLETPIARIAQMARAVGIHLILATQRPSREVITGLIKANFPTRISFKVSSRINSQIILDDVGAESLLGNGDFLMLPPGSSALTRAQGSYISDEEIQRIVSFICDQAPTNYLIESFDSMKQEDLSLGVDESSRDTLYDQARTLVLDTQTASTTFLQRKLKIGYARAASLMDELETRGVISAQEGAKPRRILADKKNSAALGQSNEDPLLLE